MVGETLTTAVAPLITVRNKPGKDLHAAVSVSLTASECVL
ncbi:MAG: hypothetical protein AVDCRST_MAG56-6968 [uncultured Cytophagales bacterium]|uniref:Uncharacterized protein n=1 Tax=uncultured Cytophagales bacterium TaxID=158755 RepID=A0A6J4L336_9SPHI|nr:MAG: hypothetical protein AVDCRST_MAG56-6968 [uncultured Cytophagales bacterium]